MHSHSKALPVGRFALRSLFVCALLILISAPLVCLAQVSQARSLDKVVGQIKAYADRHVKNESPMQTGVVVDLFRINSVGLTSTKIAQIYEEEYTKEKESYDKSPIKRLRDAGWTVSIVLILWLILGDVLRKWLARLIEKVGTFIYESLAGTRLFLGRTLSHYRRTLIEKYKLVNIPFRHGRPLDMHQLYVPLKATGSRDEGPVDASRLVIDHRRSMIIGSPGAGKS